MIRFSEIGESLLQLFFPHTCAGCGSDNLGLHNELCISCIAALPETNFQREEHNPAAKIFYGRLPLVAATVQYYFTKESLLQHLLHQLKYRNNQEIGRFLGRLTGQQLAQSHLFTTIDALVPLPLFPAKEKKRGYNQAAVIGEGMAEMMKRPVWTDVVIRTTHTETQTRKGRVERWKNMEGRFEVAKPEQIAGKHLLLVDDVITTGATLEACGAVLAAVPGVQLSVAALCMA